MHLGGRGGLSAVSCVLFEWYMVSAIPDLLLACATNSPMYTPSVIVVCYLGFCAILNHKFLQFTISYHIIQLFWDISECCFSVPKK